MYTLTNHSAAETERTFGSLRVSASLWFGGVTGAGS
jgi:hypothetical protein